MLLSGSLSATGLWRPRPGCLGEQGALPLGRASRCPSRPPLHPPRVHAPSRLAKKPTPSSLAPLRAMAPTRWPRVYGSVPGRTRWNALSGQLLKKSRILLLLTFLGLRGGRGAAGVAQLLLPATTQVVQNKGGTRAC